MLGRTKAALTGACALMFAGATQAAPPTPVFLAKAGASDLYEKQSSQIVLSSTHDKRIRDFAGEMVRDHTKSTEMLKAAATRSGLHPKPPMLDSAQRGMIAELRRAHGADRDQKYLEQQRKAHSQALDLMKDYAATGSTPALKSAAGDIVPVVQHHIDMLNGMH